jgi:single-stranded DNA-binding protein
MAYATLIVQLTSASQPPLSIDGGPEMHIYTAEIPGEPPVQVELLTKPGSKLQEALAARAAGDRVLVAGFLTARELEDDAGQVPVVTICMVCPATEEQFCNEVTVVGRVGAEARSAEKSAKTSLALNRYRQNPADPDGDPEELTDWIGVRGFGFTKGKIEKLAKGTLLEVAGSLVQMSNAKKLPFFEVRARSIRSHGKGKGGRGSAVAPKNTSSVGYSASDFEEGEDGGIGGGWD